MTMQLAPSIRTYSLYDIQDRIDYFEKKTSFDEETLENLLLNTFHQTYLRAESYGSALVPHDDERQAFATLLAVVDRQTRSRVFAEPSADDGHHRHDHFLRRTNATNDVRNGQRRRRKHLFLSGRNNSTR